MARIHRRNTQKRSSWPDNHDGMITHLEPDILECKVKWALGSITTNKASGGDGIPAELFQILKDDAALNMSANLENSAVAIELEKVSFHSNAKERQCQSMFKPPHNCTHSSCETEKAMTSHSSTLDWKIPWTEEPGRLQSMGSPTVRHKWATSLSLFTFMHWGRKCQTTPLLLPGESQGRESLVGCHLWGRTESDTSEVT